MFAANARRKKPSSHLRAILPVGVYPLSALNDVWQPRSNQHFREASAMRKINRSESTLPKSRKFILGIAGLVPDWNEHMRIFSAQPMQYEHLRHYGGGGSAKGRLAR
jgi:hypothetical protein